MRCFIFMECGGRAVRRITADDRRPRSRRMRGRQRRRSSGIRRHRPAGSAAASYAHLLSGIACFFGFFKLLHFSAPFCAERFPPRLIISYHFRCSECIKLKELPKKTDSGGQARSVNADLRIQTEIRIADDYFGVYLQIIQIFCKLHIVFFCSFVIMLYGGGMRRCCAARPPQRYTTEN